MKTFPTIKSEKDMEAVVEEYGFLPFFRSAIPGFSVEEMADPSVYFPPKGEGVWDWKDDVINGTGGTYGKFFLSRPGFVSKDFFFLLAGYRRDDYDFEGMVNDGLVTHSERLFYQILEETGSETSTFLRYKARMSKSSFDNANTRLQMKTFIVISGFDRKTTKDGRPYGWGVARYSLAENIYPDLEESLNGTRAADASAKLLSRLRAVFKDTEDAALRRIIG